MQPTFTGTRKECEQELVRRGFAFSHTGDFEGRQYWKRTDGKPDVFLDHSATITKIGKHWAISDFVHRKGIK